MRPVKASDFSLIGGAVGNLGLAWIQWYQRADSAYIGIHLVIALVCVIALRTR